METKVEYVALMCDECRNRIIKERHDPMPPGWTRYEVYDCGLTGYTAQCHRCPKCQKKK